MSRRAQSLPPTMESTARSRCTAAICMSWKVLTCVVSHVTLVALVVAYCMGGAVLFAYLESDNEIETKKSIKKLRENVTDDIWIISQEVDVYMIDLWSPSVEKRLEDFEKSLLAAIKEKGWDGTNNEETQWTFSGALFYSIIVITTIGYGHIAPKTDWGKVTTIFYAIVGIPLMLLCLSNIGDIMASSFRFLYWRVCCYVCTREPKRPSLTRSRSRSGRMTFRQSQRLSSRSQPPPTMRRSIRTSQKSADSGFFTTYDTGLVHAYSDPELRFASMNEDYRYQQPQQQDYRGRGGDYYHRDMIQDRNRNRNFSNDSPVQKRNQRFTNRERNHDRLRDRHTVERERNVNQQNRFDSNDESDVITPQSRRAQSIRSIREGSVPRGRDRQYSQTMPMNSGSSARRRSQPPRSPNVRSKSVDPRSLEEFQDGLDCKTPVFCNKYAIDEMDRRELSKNRSKRSGNPRSYSLPRQQQRFGDRLAPPISPPASPPANQRRPQYYDDDEDDDFDDEIEMQPIRKNRRDRDFQLQNQIQPQTPPLRRERTAPPSPRIMSPMGFAIHRQARLNFPDDDSFYDDVYDSSGELSQRSRPVPIWLCVFLVVSYIIAGAFLFSKWEDWEFLDSAYFCFITLTTIGFGDFVPAQKISEDSKNTIALCSLYLLFGISLLAMSFNLVQEEVIANVKSVARRLGILKEQEDEE